jgi:predicted nucleic acid-binding protein
MKACVYIETSIISYLTARPSNDIRSSAHQNSTLEWWAKHSSAFDLFVSEYVLTEAAGGHTEAAAKRLEVLDLLPILEVTNKVREISQSLLHEGALPKKAEIDSLHIAVAAAHGMEYLLTWNCKHIANAIMRPKIENACVLSGCEPPIICTPDELMQE